MPSFKLALVALAASLVSAQIDLSAIPTCALSPSLAALGSSGCAETDIKCICDSTGFLNSLLPAIEAACSASDVKKAEAFAVSLCASAGVTITIPGSGSGSGSPTSAVPAPPLSSAAPASPPSSAAPAPPTSAAPAPAASTSASPVSDLSTVYVTVPCSSGAAAPTGTITASGNLTVSATQTAQPSPFTGAAAAGYVSGATLFGGLVAAIAMLL